jgi:uncharacterized protein
MCTMANANEGLLRRGYAAFGAGDLDAVLGIFADDIAWHIGGQNQISGDYHGHQEVMAFFGKLMEITGGTFRLEVHDVLANDSHGAVLVTAYAERDGQSLEMREVQTWHLSGGKATEFWAFEEDRAKTDRFFS